MSASGQSIIDRRNQTSIPLSNSIHAIIPGHAEHRPRGQIPARLHTAPRRHDGNGQGERDRPRDPAQAEKFRAGGFTESDFSQATDHDRPRFGPLSIGRGAVGRGSNSVSRDAGCRVKRGYFPALAPRGLLSRIRRSRCMRMWAASAEVLASAMARSKATRASSLRPSCIRKAPRTPK